MRKMKLTAASLLTLGIGVDVQAYQAGDMIMRFGTATVAPNDESSTVRLNGGYIVSGGEAKVDSDTQAGVTFAYLLTENLGVELLAATPFKHNITGNKSLQGALGIKDLGEAKQLPPTLTLQYYFNGLSSSMTPYVGAGVNYTTFFSEDASHGLESTLGGKTSLKLSDSWGLAAQAGLDIQLNDNWLLNAAVWYIDIETKATFKSPAGTVKTDVRVDPWVYMAGIGYKF
jgi:outer membrane protein